MLMVVALTVLRSAVALLAEGVDRNSAQIPYTLREQLVALLAEGVDRNLSAIRTELCVGIVALLAEGVDRNGSLLRVISKFLMSPSSRRVWIEILQSVIKTTIQCVALLTEGVDRNRDTSLNSFAHREVALLAEGVDRNGYQEAWADYRMSRPPRGGRG